MNNGTLLIERGQSAAGEFTVEVDSLSSTQWDALLAQFDDANIYQTSAYGIVRWGESNLSRLVLRREGEVVAAAQLRLVRLPLIGSGVAYLRWGPMVRKIGEAFDPHVVREMISVLRNEYVCRRSLLLQILPNARSSTPSADVLIESFTGAGFKPSQDASPYRTIFVDLAPTLETIRKNLARNWRNHLNRAEKNVLTFEVRDDHTAYDEFVQLYGPMWQRKQFETSVDVGEFAKIQGLLSGRALMETFIARKDGRPVAAVICSLVGDSAIYLLGATDEQARELRAAYFLQWQVIDHLKSRGVLWYDLGGIDPDNNPGGYSFKKGFGGFDEEYLKPHFCRSGFRSAAIEFGARWVRQSRSRWTNRRSGAAAQEK